MGVCEVPDSCCGSSTSGNETCGTAAGRLQWFLLVVRSKQEPKVAEGLQAKGVISIVSFGKDFAVVDDSEIASLRAVLDSKLGPQPWPFLKTGCKIVIHGGPLKGVECVIVEVKNRLVVSITLLQRSVSVEVDREWVQSVN